MTIYIKSVCTEIFGFSAKVAAATLAGTLCGWGVHILFEKNDEENQIWLKTLLQYGHTAFALAVLAYNPLAQNSLPDKAVRYLASAALGTTTIICAGPYIGEQPKKRIFSLFPSSLSFMRLWPPNNNDEISASWSTSANITYNNRCLEKGMGIFLIGIVSQLALSLILKK